MKKIHKIIIIKENLPLTKPYTIAYDTTSQVTNIFVRLIASDGHKGCGVASPIANVTGESVEDCFNILSEKADSLLRDRNYQELAFLQRLLYTEFKGYPAALAALDMALLDLFTQSLDMPLLRFFGRAISNLPTSVTLGIKPIDASLEEILDYKEKGFKCIKIKLGSNLESDLELLTKVFERHKNDLTIRVDMNQGYRIEELQKFLSKTKSFNLELIEQPLKRGADCELLKISTEDRKLLTADESMQTVQEAYRLIGEEKTAFSIFNIKLMKCGGPSQALKIADLAQLAGKNLMWGCMDESCIGISAALNTAYSVAHTKYIDLDGSFDLAYDLAKGGFYLEDGIMKPNDKPGLGVEWNE